MGILQCTVTETNQFKVGSLPQLRGNVEKCKNGRYDRLRVSVPSMLEAAAAELVLCKGFKAKPVKKLN